MENNAAVLLTLGALFLIGLATDFVGRISRLPRVTLLLVFGLVLGSGGADLLPAETYAWFPLIADVALLLVGFLLGGKITVADLRRNGTVVLVLSAAIVVVTLSLVTAGLALLGVPLVLALLLGGVATATDPATTLDVIHENHAKGTFTNNLQGIVAIDDAWGLIAFSVVLAVCQLTVGNGAPLSLLAHALMELGGSVALGVALGLPAAWLSGRIKPGEPTLIEALGLVMLSGGLARLLELSPLLSTMVLGMVIANLARHHQQAFHEIEDIEWPFMILFFVLTGASLKFDGAQAVTGLIAGYCVLRIVARWLGGWIAGRGLGIRHGSLYGLSLLPQAGIANGMAIIGAASFPVHADDLITTAVVSTILFELLSPFLTRRGLRLAGDTRTP